jgi:hypothetical protein
MKTGQEVVADTKYRPLYDFLSCRKDITLFLDFAEMEAIVGPLPQDAATPQFWANTRHHFSRRRAWLEAGYLAFFERDGPRVRFERAASGEAWSDEELEACVLAYRKLWSAEQLGLKLDKTMLRREVVRGPLCHRNEGAYERRMQNISAVVAEMGAYPVTGYAPLRNIGAVRPRLEAIVNRIWSRRFTIITRKSDIVRAFRRWQSALLKPADYIGPIGWLPEEQIAVAAYGDAPPGKLKNKAALGVDPDGTDWAVQINIPAAPATENGLSAVARDTEGNLYLLRQGRLQSNNQSDLVSEEDFRQLSGLSPVAAYFGDTPARRAWYVVTQITDDEAEMRGNTAGFVKICADIRAPGAMDGARGKADVADFGERFGKDEQDGTSTYWAKGGSRLMRRRHAQVWQALNAVLRKSGRKLWKPAPARGYETDGEIIGQSGNVLIEIKTGRSAVEVYAGVGQLLLYSKMLSRLDGHRKVLLLPGKPTPILAQALSEIGVELHLYEVADPEDWGKAVFSKPFLELCEIVPKRRARVT